MLHPEIMRLLAAERTAALRDAARRPVARQPAHAPVTATPDFELRLCRTGDDIQLAHLAELEGRPTPFGRVVVGVVGGRIVAAVPIAGGRPLADPFVATDHIVPLLELRAAQLREPEPRRRLLPRYVGLIRGSIHA